MPARLQMIAEGLSDVEVAGHNSREKLCATRCSGLTDFAEVSTQSNATLDPYYKFRVLRTKQFAR